MTLGDNRPGPADRTSWTFAAIALAAACFLMAMNGMVDLGAAAHDAFCPEHGRLV